jgi:DNA-binding winged helix-turn-helix (wHTH) protein
MYAVPIADRPIAAETGEDNRPPGDAVAELRFGQYRVIPGARTVLADGKPLKLGSRAFDLLVVLLQAAGTIVSREELIRQVWPTTTVDEANLRFQMTVLRRALGDDRGMISTVPGRGYLLAIDVADASVPYPAPRLERLVAPFGPKNLAGSASGREALRQLLYDFADEICSAILPEKEDSSERVAAPESTSITPAVAPPC